jgi:hypothetical protein
MSFSSGIAFDRWAVMVDTIADLLGDEAAVRARLPDLPLVVDEVAANGAVAAA